MLSRHLAGPMLVTTAVAALTASGVAIPGGNPRTSPDAPMSAG